MVRSTATSCAKQIRSRATAEGWGIWRTVTEIRATCRPSWLAAHRLARGWTLEQAVTRLAQIRAARVGADSVITVQMLNSWERERVVPSLASIDLLCQLYETRPDRLGFGRDYGPTDTTHSPRRPAARTEITARSARPPDRPDIPAGPVSMGTIMQVRHGLEDLLAAGPGADLLDRWEQAVQTYTLQARYRSASQMVNRVVPEFARAQRELTARYPMRHHRQVAHILARLAGIISFGLMGLTQHKESEAWARSAGVLAAESGDRQLGAWVMARLAMTRSDVGALNASLDWSRAARRLARDRDCAGVAWAWATESSVLAQMGRTAEARTALRRTEDLFNRQSADPVSPLFSYNQLSQYMIEATTYARLGDVDRTYQAASRAHAVLPADHHPLVRIWPEFHVALSMAVANDFKGACQAAARCLSEAERHGGNRMLQLRGREIVGLVPAADRNRPHTRELMAVLRRDGTRPQVATGGDH